MYELAACSFVLLHVSWNLLARASKDSPAFLFWAKVGHCLMASPLVVWLLINHEIPSEVWICAGISSLALSLYVIGLVKPTDTHPLVLSTQLQGELALTHYRLGVPPW